MTTDFTNQNELPEQAGFQHPIKEEVNLRELLMVLWKGKTWIVGITFVAAVISVSVALWLPDIYRSEALLAVDEEGGSGLASLASQYGGLASLAGIAIPSGGGSDKAIGIAKIQSRQFIAGLIERHNLLPELMAAKSFDWNSRELSFDNGIYDVDSETWSRKVKVPRLPTPSALEAYGEFLRIFDVSEDVDTGFVTVSIEHLSPIVAQRWVTWLVEELNNEMMLEATDEAQQSIDFLTDQLSKTQVVALEEVFYSLIEEQTKTIMLANSRPEYLFKIIDPAVIPEDQTSPNRPLIAILGTILGGLLGIAFVLGRNYRLLTS